MNKKIIFCIVGLVILGVGIYFLISPYERCLREVVQVLADKTAAIGYCGKVFNGGVQ